MSAWDGVKIAVLLFVAAVAQVSIFSQIDVFGAAPDLLLVTLVAISLLRGSIAGAAGGFFAGLLVDTASLGRSASRRSSSRSPASGSAGTGRRPAATAPTRRISRSRSSRSLRARTPRRPLRARRERPAGAVFASLLPAVLLNLVLTGPVYAVVRRLLRPQAPAELSAEVQLLG